MMLDEGLSSEAKHASQLVLDLGSGRAGRDGGMKGRKGGIGEDTSDRRQGHPAVASSRRTNESVIFLRGFFALVISHRLQKHR